jgi:DNA-binding MarR family transcriptional regulator
MDIGEIIHQKSFKSPHQKAILNIIYTAGWLQLEQTHIFRPFELSPQQYNVLRILRGRKPDFATVAYIQERMLDRMSNASRLVDKLEDKGLVRRSPSKSDKRQTNIAITPKGLELLAKIDEDFEGENIRFANLTENEADILSSLLDKLRG